MNNFEEEYDGLEDIFAFYSRMLGVVINPEDIITEEIKYMDKTTRIRRCTINYNGQPLIISETMLIPDSSKLDKFKLEQELKYALEQEDYVKAAEIKKKLGN